MRVRSASLLLALLLACAEPSTEPSTPSSTVTPPLPAPGIGMTAAPAGVPAKLVSCDNVANAGNIVKVVSSPEHKYWPASNNPFNVFGQIIRDDASFPGVQYHCEDTGMQVSWTVYFSAPYCLTIPWNNGEAYSEVLQLTCGASGSVWRAIAVPVTAGGNVASPLRDTTYVHH